VARARPDLVEFEPWLRQTLRRGERGRTEAARQDTGGLVLSTVHRVKGLEWPHVIVWDASDGVIPHHLNRTGTELEEERRVFHVALTRGQDSVTVVARTGLESPFLAEMAGKRSRRTPLAIARRRSKSGPNGSGSGTRHGPTAK
jgi:superfamily I DNA/RNA helicase